MHREAAAFFAQQLNGTPEGRAARAYLLDRGLDIEGVARFGMWLRSIGWRRRSDDNPKPVRRHHLRRRVAFTQAHRRQRGSLPDFRRERLRRNRPEQPPLAIPKGDTQLLHPHAARQRQHTKHKKHPHKPHAKHHRSRGAR